MADAEAILLVRLDGVGDAALCIPALEGLHRVFPGARFGAICSKANAQLFSGRIATIHRYDAGTRVETLRDELQSERYTRALIATEEVAGYLLARLSGAPKRAGFWHGWQKPFKSLWQRAQVTAPVFRPAARVDKPEHEVVTMYRLAQALGATQPVPSQADELRAWLHVQTNDRTHAAQGAVAFQVTPKLATQGWGPAALAALFAGALTASGRERAVLLASSQDESLACSVLALMPRVVTEGGKVSVLASLQLQAWLGAIEAASALVTPDTGAAHVAGMLGAGVIDLFDEPDFERLSQQWQPWAGASRCLVKQAWRPGVEAQLGQQIGVNLRDVMK